MKYDIFISYRREGGYDVAKHLYDLLSRDGYKVSFDIDTLRNGDFDTQLLTRVEQCKDFILIVDEHTFDRTIDPSFNPNNDWLRQELVHALKYDKNIKERSYGMRGEISYIATSWLAFCLEGEWQARGHAKSNTKTYHQEVGIKTVFSF